MASITVRVKGELVLVVVEAMVVRRRRVKCMRGCVRCV